MRLASVVAVMMLGAGAAAAGPRVASLDQCADQYVLALADRSDIAFLSPRALAADSWLKARAVGLPIHRPSVEAVVAARPDVVVRQWGGGPGLSAALARNGVRSVRVEEARDFNAVARDVRTIAAALGHPDRGERLIADMRTKLAGARGRWKGADAVYLTDGAFTAGTGTLVDAVLRAAGLTNRSRAKGYGPAPLERLMLAPPAVVVFGRFDTPGHGRWSPVKGPVLEHALMTSRRVELPGALLGCPAWFVAEAAARLAAAAP